KGVAALMAAPTTGALADMHREATTDRPWLGQLVLILVLDPLLQDLPTALAPLTKRRVELLINLPRRLTVTMPRTHRQTADLPGADFSTALPARTVAPDAWPRAAPPPARPRASPLVSATGRSPRTNGLPRPTTTRSQRPTSSTAPPTAQPHPPARPPAP